MVGSWPSFYVVEMEILAGQYFDWLVSSSQDRSFVKVLAVHARFILRIFRYYCSDRRCCDNSWVPSWSFDPWG